jgi:hypothetical protein
MSILAVMPLNGAQNKAIRQGGAAQHYVTVTSASKNLV